MICTCVFTVLTADVQHGSRASLAEPPPSQLHISHDHLKERWKTTPCFTLWVGGSGALGSMEERTRFQFVLRPADLVALPAMGDFVALYAQCVPLSLSSCQWGSEQPSHHPQ